MHETKQKLDQIKKAIKDSNKASLNFDKTKEGFIIWLSQFDFPAYPDSANWEECLESFPDPSPDCKKPTNGLKLRFLLKLHTSKHRYIISIVECFDADAIGVGLLTVHVNLDQTEYNIQKAIETTYKNSFDNSLKPKQVLFVEPFRNDTFFQSLRQAGLSILGHELLGQTPKQEQSKIKHNIPQHVHFPDTE